MSERTASSLLSAAMMTAAASAVVLTGAGPKALSAQAAQSARYSSTIMTYDLNTSSTTLVHQADGVWEAPNWSRDGRALLTNSGGRLYRVPIDRTSPPEAIDLDASLRCNNDHDFSPDGRLLAISASSPASRQSQVHVANADGSGLRLLVSAAPSYFHGWSPDGTYLSFVANRDGKQYDLYRVPAAGGVEERLTFDPAYDDGPDYSRDGKWIYFNSNRGGGWNIWRIPADGAGPGDRKAQRITNDDLEDWFPHPSPDGKSLLFLSFPHGTEGHNERALQVQLRIIPTPGETVRDVQPRSIAAFTGGQGSINVNSWAPDARRFAYVSYEVQPPAQYPSLPSETPARLQPVTDGFDYIRRDVMIPMRDGVKLHTVILVPKGALGKTSAPILLTRTPYNANDLTTHAQSAHLGPILTGYDNATDVIVEGGYIRVVQDVRGKYGSEGDYVMNRPLRGPQNPTPVDHATDTYDTIDWLVKNIPESNGKVGILGISYDGFLPLMALVNPHPALKVSVPMNPMVDGWMGDDWFHNGAFRQQNMPYIYEQVGTRANDAKWWTTHFDDYDMFMQAGSAGELGRRRGLEQVGFWRKILDHPSYDAFWRDQAVDKALAAAPLTVPVMLVHSLWDQEDIYGAIAVYKAIKPKDTANDKVFLVLGPWHHGQEIAEASTLGALRFESDTAAAFRRDVLRPFLDRYLNDGAPRTEIPPVVAFETGTNTWRRLPAWPAGCTSGCTIQPTPLYLSAGLKLSLAAPKAGDAAFDEYVSDPAKPVPFRARPIQPVGYDHGLTWPQWLVDDQREASGRPDVAVFVSDVLTAPTKISGQPIANLVASTSGTDSDWVVKVIDVYPDEVAAQPAMGGYQLMVSADIFRGRYRESLETPKPIVPDTPSTYRFALPTANHVFLPGHKIMVQIQSSWFPLYDRNPQTFVPNIFWAKPGDYRRAVQRIYHAPGQASFVELPMVMTRP